MSDVEFDSDLTSRPSYAGRPGSSGYPYSQSSENKGIQGWLIRKGLAKNNQSAVVVCAIIVIANLAIIFWSWQHANSTPPGEVGVPAQDIYPGHYVNSYHPAQ